jgi:glycyl-tRNA synthetase beta chain
MMADFLLELRSEEIPARMQEKACADLARLFAAEIAKAGLEAKAIETFATPRRLALIARGLPLATEAVREELKGPRATAPEQAIAGFLGKNGLTRDQLVEQADAKGNVTLFAMIDRPGRATAEVLAEAIPAIILAFPWPKSMRWGEASASAASLRWVRPLQGIVALLGDDVVPCAIDGTESGRTTLGHRFHHQGAVTIANAAGYASALRAAYVILDPAERRAIIAAGAAKAAGAAGLSLVPDEGLVAENAGLTEWPVPLLGAFDPAFLEVPREVIQLTMRTNQKYFACVDKEGRLAPAFVCTANIEASDGGKAIAAGNARVLAARLSDAKFFWEQDLKVPLAEQARKLDQIVFHEKLGTVADKVERVAKLARWLVEEGIVGSVTPAQAGAHRPGAGESSPAAAPMDSRLRGNDSERALLADQAEQAAKLCKADLVTGMVGEFPELQGVIGGYYARAEGLPDAVADAIRDHYKPVGQGDEVPTAPVTVAVSLADKLDTLTTFFSQDMRPTGSKDPFALRRAALHVIAILLATGFRLRLKATLFERVTGWANPSYGDLAERFADAAKEVVGQTPLHSEASVALALEDEMEAYHEEVARRAGIVDASLLDFFADRLKVQQREAGVRHDLIDAVFALGGEDDLVRLLARVHALQAFVASDDGANLLVGYKRAANILRIEEKRDGAAFEATTALAYEPQAEEAALLAALDRVEPLASAAVEAEDFEGAMAALSHLRAPIDAFFEKVTVNDDDRARRSARLGLLVRIRDAVHRVADFSKIEG